MQVYTSSQINDRDFIGNEYHILMNGGCCLASQIHTTLSDN